MQTRDEGRLDRRSEWLDGEIAAVERQGGGGQSVSRVVSDGIGRLQGKQGEQGKLVIHGNGEMSVIRRSTDNVPSGAQDDLASGSLQNGELWGAT